ncbi:hypothetical protein PFFCH_04929 [Plasmodium falciparum FCH/4]|uniref:Uncharacterized protein n=1 Tax=Plasmodium falciparum FCH/4 TaxID=1036724 RepID=A0A024VI96_PLAFA|nr:hypothetical protein PFFCH_04929 [Plasmodium falciparum FCH/4]
MYIYIIYISSFFNV